MNLRREAQPDAVTPVSPLGYERPGFFRRTRIYRLGMYFKEAWDKTNRDHQAEKHAAQQTERMLAALEQDAAAPPDRRKVDWEVVKDALRNNADPNAQDSQVLWIAAQNGDRGRLDVVQLALADGEKVVPGSRKVELINRLVADRKASVAAELITAWPDLAVPVTNGSMNAARTKVSEFRVVGERKVGDDIFLTTAPVRVPGLDADPFIRWLMNVPGRQQRLPPLRRPARHPGSSPESPLPTPAYMLAPGSAAEPAAEPPAPEAAAATVADLAAGELAPAFGGSAAVAPEPDAAPATVAIVLVGNDTEPAAGLAGAASAPALSPGRS